MKFLSFQPGKLTLSMLQREPLRPLRVDLTPFAAVREPLLGRVAHVAEAAIFVAVQVDGLQADAMLRHADAVGDLKVGQLVRVRLSEVDPKAGRLRVVMAEKGRRRCSGRPSHGLISGLRGTGSSTAEASCACPGRCRTPKTRGFLILFMQIEVFFDVFRRSSRRNHAKRGPQRWPGATRSASAHPVGSA